MRIGIDARFLTHPQAGGFKTYTENLVAALAVVDEANEYVLYVDREASQDSVLASGRNVVVQVVPASLPMAGMAWREQVGLVRQVRKDRIDLFHAPCLTAPLRISCPFVVTIHDTIWSSPHGFARTPSRSLSRKPMEWYYRIVPLSAARHAAAVITVSQAAKRSIVADLRLRCADVFVTHEAAGPAFRRLAGVGAVRQVRRKYGLDGDFILALGSADPRKNLEALLRAYAFLPDTLRERYRLAVVWTHSLLADGLSASAQALGVAGRVQYLHDVSNDELVGLYNAATLFVFPSLHEGFGLPPLEAMSCGTPVVASDNSSIPEIVGDAALLANASDPASIAAMTRQALADERLRAELSRRGLERARCFTWAGCARETVAVYERVMSSRRALWSTAEAHRPRPS